MASQAQITRFVSSEFFCGSVIPVVLFADCCPQDTPEAIMRRYCASKYPQELAESYMTALIYHVDNFASCSDPTVTREEKLMVAWYTSDIRDFDTTKKREDNWWAEVNTALFTRNKTALCTLRDGIWFLQSAYEKLSKSSKPCTLWRGVDKRLTQVSKHYAPNKKVCWPSFTPTSTDQSVIMDFAAGGGSLIKIEAACYADFSELSMRPLEAESLLGVNTVVEVENTIPSEQLAGYPGAESVPPNVDLIIVKQVPTPPFGILRLFDSGGNTIDGVTDKDRYSAAIEGLQRAASAHEMVDASRQIISCQLTALTDEQLIQLTHALTVAARWASNAQAVLAWARIIEQACSEQTQATKDAFGTPATVAAFAQLAGNATTAGSAQSLTDAIWRITDGATQATKDAFAAPAMVAAFLQLAGNATTAESVQSLAAAIRSITFGTTQATADAFSTPLMVSAFVQLADNATTAESVQSLTDAICNITFGTTQTAFATSAMVAALVQLAGNATTAKSVESLTDAICNITDEAAQATKDAFSTPLMVSAFVQLAGNATTAESVQSLTAAIQNIAAGATQATKDAFATPAMVAAFVQLAGNATTSESVQCLTDAICTISAGTTQATGDAFSTPLMVSAFVQLFGNATTAECVQSLTDAIYCITAGATQATKDAFATPAMVAAFVQLAGNATTADSVQCLAEAICNITSGTTQATGEAFATPPVEAALRSLFSVASTNASRSALEAALAGGAPRSEGVSSEDIVRHTSRFCCSRVHQQESAVCAVCLEEFRLRENMRELRCTHRFHRRCIDQWLSSHSTCPLCIQPIVPPDAAAAPTSNAFQPVVPPNAAAAPTSNAFQPVVPPNAAAAAARQNGCCCS